MGDRKPRSDKKKKFLLRSETNTWEELELLRFQHTPASFNEIINMFIEFGLRDLEMVSRVKACLPAERENTYIIEEINLKEAFKNVFL